MVEHRVISKLDAGCWIDGSRGWYGNVLVIRDAIEHGMVLTSQEKIDLYLYRTSNGQDSAGVIDQGDLVDRATEYLDSQAPEGYCFTWRDGELFLEEVEDENNV